MFGVAAPRAKRVLVLRLIVKKAVQVCAGIAISVNASSAGIIDVFGNVSVLPTPPTSVQEGALESDSNVFAFAEQQNVVLSADLRANFTAPGFYGDRSDLPFPVPVIPAGTAVSSFFVHADPETRGIDYSGSITFDTDVLGVMLGGVLLEESDFLGPPGTLFPIDAFASGRGLALSGQDVIALTLDARTVLFAFRTGQLIDQFRIVTEAATVPEPALSLLVGGASLAFVAVRRRRGRVSSM